MPHVYLYNNITLTFVLRKFPRSLRKKKMKFSTCRRYVIEIDKRIPGNNLNDSVSDIYRSSIREKRGLTLVTHALNLEEKNFEK